MPRSTAAPRAPRLAAPAPAARQPSSAPAGASAPPSAREAWRRRSAGSCAPRAPPSSAGCQRRAPAPASARASASARARRPRRVTRAPARLQVDLWPESGRRHQLRAHMASIGHPLGLAPPRPARVPAQRTLRGCAPGEAAADRRGGAGSGRQGAPDRDGAIRCGWRLGAVSGSGAARGRRGRRRRRRRGGAGDCHVGGAAGAASRRAPAGPRPGPAWSDARARAGRRAGG